MTNTNRQQLAKEITEVVEKSTGGSGIDQQIKLRKQLKLDDDAVGEIAGALNERFGLSITLDELSPEMPTETGEAGNMERSDFNVAHMINLVSVRLSSVAASSQE